MAGSWVGCVAEAREPNTSLVPHAWRFSQRREAASSLMPLVSEPEVCRRDRSHLQRAGFRPTKYSNRFRRRRGCHHRSSPPLATCCPAIGDQGVSDLVKELASVLKAKDEELDAVRESYVGGTCTLPGPAQGNRPVAKAPRRSVGGSSTSRRNHHAARHGSKGTNRVSIYRPQYQGDNTYASIDIPL